MGVGYVEFYWKFTSIFEISFLDFKQFFIDYWSFENTYLQTGVWIHVTLIINIKVCFGLSIQKNSRSILYLNILLLATFERMELLYGYIWSEFCVVQEQVVS